jgi:CRP/FNR family cyclic AMP-dependent transcriptional regulator
LIHNYRRGQPIYFEGDPPGPVYVVAEGLVKEFTTSDDGEHLLFDILGPGSTFGELPLIDSAPRDCSVEAVEQTTVLVVPQRALQKVMREDPAVSLALLGSLAYRLRQRTEQASDVVFMGLESRVAKLLARYAREAPPAKDGSVRVEIGVTQADLASMVGGSRQSVNQVLKALERRRYISVEGRSIIVKAPEILEQRSRR